MDHNQHVGKSDVSVRQIPSQDTDAPPKLPPKPSRLSYAEPTSPSSKLNKPPVLPPRLYNDPSSPTAPNVPPPVSFNDKKELLMKAVRICTYYCMSVYPYCESHRPAETCRPLLWRSELPELIYVATLVTREGGLRTKKTEAKKIWRECVMGAVTTGLSLYNVAIF